MKSEINLERYQKDEDFLEPGDIICMSCKYLEVSKVSPRFIYFKSCGVFGNSIIERYRRKKWNHYQLVVKQNAQIRILPSKIEVGMIVKQLDHHVYMEVLDIKWIDVSGNLSQNDYVLTLEYAYKEKLVIECHNSELFWLLTYDASKETK